MIIGATSRGSAGNDHMSACILPETSFSSAPSSAIVAGAAAAMKATTENQLV